MYFGIADTELGKFINASAARRYLATLILFNDREKADFDLIAEASPNAEMESN